MPFVLKPVTFEDATLLGDLFREVRAVEFIPLGLPEPALHQLLDMQFRAQSLGYAAQFPNAADNIVWVDGEPVGRLLTNVSDDEMRLVDVALFERFRRKGIGASLLASVCEQAKKAKLPLRLSVRSGNPAERLYARCGFVRTGGDGAHIFMELGAVSQDGRTEDPAIEFAEQAGPVEQGMTSAYFRTLVGHSLHVRSAGIIQTDLMVRDVSLIPVPAVGPKVDAGDSFVVTLHGPLEPVLPSENVEMTPQGAEPMVVFLCPRGPQQGVMVYDMIFNRMMPRTA
jgi:GNAT superfamily N-acetyltransferase